MPDDSLLERTRELLVRSDCSAAERCHRYLHEVAPAEDATPGQASRGTPTLRMLRWLGRNHPDTAESLLVTAMRTSAAADDVSQAILNAGLARPALIGVGELPGSVGQGCAKFLAACIEPDARGRPRTLQRGALDQALGTIGRRQRETAFCASHVPSFSADPAASLALVGLQQRHDSGESWLLDTFARHGVHIQTVSHWYFDAMVCYLATREDATRLLQLLKAAVPERRATGIAVSWKLYSQSRLDRAFGRLVELDMATPEALTRFLAEPGERERSDRLQVVLQAAAARRAARLAIAGAATGEAPSPERSTP